MSEHGSNGSIEEIGAEEVEQIMFEDEKVAEAVLPEAAVPEQVENAPAVEDSPPTPSANTADPAPAEDPPLDDLVPVPAQQDTDSLSAAAAPVAEPSPADAIPVAEPPPAVEPAQPEQPADDVEEVPRPPQPDPPQGMRLVRPAPAIEDDGEEDDEDIDETLAERLMGLSEMFPESLRAGTTSLVKNSWSGSQYLYGFTRSAAWILFSTASILFMPVMIETERLSILDQQKQAKTQMLLGPGVAASGAPSLGPPPI